MACKPSRNFPKFSWQQMPAHLPLPMAELISAEDAAKLLGFSVRTLTEWGKRELMPPRQKRGKRLLYRVSDIQRLAEEIEKWGAR